MRDAPRISVEVEVELSPGQIAAAFAGMSDDEQAQVFIEVAAIAKSWPDDLPGRIDQWYAVGRHLRDCSCGTDEARELVRRIADGVGPRE